MPAKKLTKKKVKRSTAKKITRKKTAPRFMVQDSLIKAGRDVIIGNQYNDYRQQIAHIASPREFALELEKLQKQIAEIKQQANLDSIDIQTIEVVEGRVKEAIEESQKPQPVAERITSALDKAKKTIDSLSGSVTAAIGLCTVIAGFGQVALKLFGG